MCPEIQVLMTASSVAFVQLRWDCRSSMQLGSKELLSPDQTVYKVRSQSSLLAVDLVTDQYWLLPELMEDKHGVSISSAEQLDFLQQCSHCGYYYLVVDLIFSWQLGGCSQDLHQCLTIGHPCSVVHQLGSVGWFWHIYWLGDIHVYCVLVPRTFLGESLLWVKTVGSTCFFTWDCWLRSVACNNHKMQRHNITSTVYQFPNPCVSRILSSVLVDHHPCLV